MDGLRWPQQISRDNPGADVTLLATYKWLVDVKGVKVRDEYFVNLENLLFVQIFNQADKAVLVTNDNMENVGALAEKILCCKPKYLKSKISDSK